MKLIAVLVLIGCVGAFGRLNEVKDMPGHQVKNMFSSPLPHTYTDANSLPANFNWGDINGKSFLTKSLNQHIPQYCGSCWAHGALSSLADRIKIARNASGIDYNLAIQYILNCGGYMAGSCYGGSATGTFEFIKHSGFVPYDTCLQYEACSSDSKEGFCNSKHDQHKCSGINTCRTCSTFSEDGGFCAAIDHFPNASIAEYGQVTGADNMMAEIYARGPIACGVDAQPIEKYQGGIVDIRNAQSIDHIISVVGWGMDVAVNKSYWIVRNSWGEFWGEMGYFRVVKGENQLGIESMCSWATPKTFTTVNYPCYEDGTNCVSSQDYVDPSAKNARAYGDVHLNKPAAQVTEEFGANDRDIIQGRASEAELMDLLF